MFNLNLYISHNTCITIRIFKLRIYSFMIINIISTKTEYFYKKLFIIYFIILTVAFRSELNNYFTTNVCLKLF